MATISGKRFQITDGASTPTNLFPYTVTEAVYGLSTVIENAKTAVTSVLSAVTLNGVSKAGTTASFYAPTTAGTTGQILKATTSGAPVWTSAALGASNKPVYLNSSGVLTEGVSCLPLTGGTLSNAAWGEALIINRAAAGGESAIKFTSDGTLVGIIGVKAAMTPVFYPGNETSGNGYTIYHSGNFRAGTEYVSISGTETITGAKTFSNTVTLTYGTNLVFTGASSDAHSVRVFVNYPNDLSHHDGTAWRRIYDSGNSNKSDVAWACSTLTANSEVIAPTITAKSDTYPAVTFADSTQARWIFSKRSTASDLHLIRYTSSQTYDTVMAFAYSSGNVGIGNTTPSYKLDVAGAGRFYGAMTSGISLYLHNTTTASSWIQFGYNNTALGWVGVTNAYSIVAQNASGTNVMYVNTFGTLTTTGDQVVSSDLTLKENLTPVTYSVSDIAKARAVEFDWKDGRGHSMGSIAQDWLGIAPALVHGEEGNMSLAYGQLALVNTILLARQSESHEERIARLEKENAELKEEVKRLRMN